VSSLSDRSTRRGRARITNSAALVVSSAALFVSALAACTQKPTPPAGEPHGVPTAATFDASKPGELAANSAVPSPSPSAAAAPAQASSVGGAAPSASVATAPSAAPAPSASAALGPDGLDPSWDLKNGQRPSAPSDDLTAKASHLFAAVQKDDPSLAADYFFPRAAFLPVKDIGNPGKYWDTLFRTYNRDIHDLHVKHASKMANAQFVDIQPGSPAKWVPPGEEANKIGYFRSFNAKVRYRDGETYGHFDVRVSITWQGKWYITHLLPWK
jgi:hypothetical protein